MKKIATLCFVLICSFAVLGQNHFINHFTLDPNHPDYVKNEVLVKFKDNTTISTTFKSGKFKTGIDSLDVLLKNLKVTSMTRVFKGSRKLKSARVFKNRKGQWQEVPQLFNIYQIKFKSAVDVQTMAKKISRLKNVDYAEPDYLFYTDDLINKHDTPVLADHTVQKTSSALRADSSPNDPFFQDGSQPYLNTVDAPKAWTVTTGDSTGIIGVLDTGVDTGHPDLKNNGWTNPNEIPGNGIDDDHNGYVDDVHGWDFVNHDNAPKDDNSHGTHVAGIAAAEGNNGIGITGVAWHARIMPIKVMQSSGYGSSSDIAKGVNYAAQNGATVINMSIGGYGESQTLKIALENAYAGTGNGKGAIIVAAAGNDHLRVDDALPNVCGKYSYGVKPAPAFPAAYPFVIGVMASDAGPCNGFSNWDFSGPVSSTNGFNYEIEAPGTGILSTKPDGNYWQKSGTSMACPVVAGAVALLRNHTPTLSGEQIFARLIQGVNNGVLDIYKSLTMKLMPDLRYMGFSIVDTLPGDKPNGTADAGETIQLYLHIKNAGGQTDSVYSKIAFAPFEDATVATILDSTSFIGSIGTYGEMNGGLDPFLIKINPKTANNRDIMFRVTYGDSLTTHSADITLRVENGVLYQGYVHGLTVLSPDKYYIITGNTVFDSLIIKPGTILRLNDSASILINQYIKADGKPDSLITFTHNGSGNWASVKNAYGQAANINYGVFEYSDPQTGKSANILNNFDTIANSVFRNNGSRHTGILFDSPNISLLFKNVFTQNKAYFFSRLGGGGQVQYNTVIDNASDYQPVVSIYYVTHLHQIKNNVFYNNVKFDNQTQYSLGILSSVAWGIYKASPNYYGTTDSTKIEHSIEDFFENSSKPIVSGYDSAQSQPSPLCHGVPWKVEINGVNVNKYDHPYNKAGGLGVVGAQRLRFQVFFNRPMNTAYTPLLTFGVREPYTQHIVTDSASWSADSTVWSASADIGQNTGDGIQQIRVANARDNEDFEIPLEYTRFQFVVQAASAASIDFRATPGIGKVKLEWPATKTADVQGYNIYRFHNLTDSTYSDTILANPELVTDTVYTDFNVIPDTTYHYLYKTVNTDLTQSDYSKTIVARPFSAANGDANGDLHVNILDLTTIVAYILDKNPQPFLFDAADVNYDGQINVLDVISIVKLILGTKETAAGMAWNGEPATIAMQNHVIRLQSDHQLAALQFELNGKNLSKVRLTSLLNGFEFSYGVVDGKLTGLLYSFTGKLIPGGLQDIIHIENAPDSLQWGKVFGSDADGNLVKVNIGEITGIHQLVSHKNTLQVSPNPFNENVTIRFRLEKASRVQMDVYNINGQKVKTLLNATKTAGSYTLTWRGLDRNKKELPSGIYFCKMLITPSNGGPAVKKEIKLVRIK